MEATNSKIIKADVNLNYFFIFCNETSYRFFPPSKERIVSKVNLVLVRQSFGVSLDLLPLNWANSSDWPPPSFPTLNLILVGPQALPETHIHPLAPSASSTLVPFTSCEPPQPCSGISGCGSYRSFRGEATLNTLAFLGPNEESLHLSHCLWITTKKSRSFLQWQSWGATKDSWACPMHSSWGIQKCQWGERSLSIGLLGDRGHGIWWAKPKMKGTCAITVTEKWCRAWSPTLPLDPSSRGIQVYGIHDREN